MLFKIGDKSKKFCSNCDAKKGMTYAGYDITGKHIAETWKCEECGEILRLEKCCNSCCHKFNYGAKHCLYSEKKPLQDTSCGKYKEKCEECESEDAEYLYEGSRWCCNCLKTKLGIEDNTFTYYYHDGECIGSEDDNMIDVFEQLDEGVEEL